MARRRAGRGSAARSPPPPPPPVALLHSVHIVHFVASFSYFLTEHVYMYEYRTDGVGRRGRRSYSRTGQLNVSVVFPVHVRCWVRISHSHQTYVCARLFLFFPFSPPPKQYFPDFFMSPPPRTPLSIDESCILRVNQKPPGLPTPVAKICYQVLSKAIREEEIASLVHPHECKCKQGYHCGKEYVQHLLGLEEKACKVTRKKQSPYLRLSAPPQLSPVYDLPA